MGCFAPHSPPFCCASSRRRGGKFPPVVDFPPALDDIPQPYGYELFNHAVDSAATATNFGLSARLGSWAGVMMPRVMGKALI